jgi:hypothetical protein
MVKYYDDHREDPEFVDSRRRASRSYYQRLKEERPEEYKKYIEKRRAIAKEKQLAKQYYWDNKQHVQTKNAEWYANSGKAKRKVSKTDAPWYYLWKSRRAAAKQEGIEFTITVEYVETIWTDVCPILGVPFQIQTKSDPNYNRNLSPSIDRIDPSKGYVEGNVAVISFRANRLKNDGTLEEHRRLVSWMESL